LNVIMIGPPGAGKGTQALRFARARGLAKISTGDILREAIKAETPVGLKVQATMERGELVDDATMIAIVRERLMRPDAMAGFLLDGFPRTVEQAEALDQIVEERGNGPLVVVDVRVPLQELVRRLDGRLVCSTCGTNADPFGPTIKRCGKCDGEFVQRHDDDRSVVVERLKVYERQTYPLVKYYQERPTFRVVNGAQRPEDVAFQLDTVIDDAAAVGAMEKAES
ncbi:MAG: adenylate kinase, partial [Vicinamibacterales bacterium]